MILRLTLHGNVYLNPVTEEATLRCRLGFPELTVSRRVLSWFVERYRAELRPDEASLLKMWGNGASFRDLVDCFEGAEIFHMTA